MSVLLGSLVAVPAVAGTALLIAGRRAERVAGAVGVAAGAAVTVLAAVGSLQRPSVRAPFVAAGDLAL